MAWVYLINVVFVYLSWKWATEAFEKGNDTAGWLNIFASAINAAAVASHFF